MQLELINKSEIKTALWGINGRINEAKFQIRDLENKEAGNTQSEQVVWWLLRNLSHITILRQVISPVPITSRHTLGYLVYEILKRDNLAFDSINNIAPV